ncbi:MAG: hypothetical protein AUJ56_05450 [Zetaproteobacteria bacterium CG1_02_49_23]|nr:MAG: hypothetical protein AUJ56_05450 [Zetaproteobacteria bacterium CG1_02_49_23]
MTADSALRRQLFITLGLTDKEALIYDLLLTHGPMGSGVIERESKMKKNTYSLLRSLQRKHLLSITLQDGKKLYVPAPPDELMLTIKEQRRALASTQSLLETALPELQTAYQTNVGVPIIRHYQGKTGLREVLELTYQAGKDKIYGCVGWLKPSKMLEEVAKTYSHLRVERGIFTYAINNDNAGGQEFVRRSQDPSTLSEVRLIDSKKYPLPAEIDVWEDTITMFCFENKDFQGIVIKHPEFAITLQSIFTLLFDLLRQKKV